MDSNPNPSFVPYSPLEMVAHLDMIGQIMLQKHLGIDVPPLVFYSAISILRCIRDDIANANNIGEECQYGTPQFTAECMMRDIAEKEEN